jgi:uncharacterized protein YkwD
MIGALLAFLMFLGTVVAPIQWDGQLEGLAQERATQLAQGAEFRHTDYIPSQLAYCGCGLYGEMLGRTSGSVIDLFHAFLNSPSHRAIMLSDWDSIAVAVSSNETWHMIIVVSYLGDCN